MRRAAAVAFVVLLAACDPAPEGAPQQQSADVAEGGAMMAAAPEAAPAYVGTWAPDAAGCAIPQEQQGAPHIITEDGFDQHEAHCSFVAVTPMGDNEWRVGAQCTVEGDEQNTAFDLAVEGDTLRIAGGPPQVRCP
jgi:hypothetical protein